jgi:threonyl-tRNA synthetase
MIHRAIYGSLERFIGILIEHYAGAFPLWLAPEQVRVLPITDRCHDYAMEVLEELRKKGIRAEMDTRNEKIGYKIREAQMQKLPLMLLIGDKEVEAKTVSVRDRVKGDLGAMSLSDFCASIEKEASLPLSDA